MSMRMPVRINYSESLVDQQALAAVGGTIVCPKGKPPQFAFSSQLHYQEYLNLRKKNDHGGNRDHSDTL